MLKTFFISSLLVAGASPIFSILDFGADVNYLSLSGKTTSTSGSSSTNSTGYVITPYVHVTFSIPRAVTFGIGPYVGFGGLTPSNSTSSSSTVTVNSTKDTTIRYGADFMVTVDAVPVVKPFGRLMLGGESIEETLNYTVSGSRIETVTGYSAFQYSMLGGIKIPFASVFGIYLQLGVTGTTNGSLTPKSATINGAAATYTISGNPQFSYTGIMVGGGIFFSF